VWESVLARSGDGRDRKGHIESCMHTYIQKTEISLPSCTQCVSIMRKKPLENSNCITAVSPVEEKEKNPPDNEQKDGSDKG
jgi:hypothetical protein